MTAQNSTAPRARGAASTAADALLRTAIRVDGVVVAALGIALVAAAGPMSMITGLPIGVEYGIGVFSIAYGPLAFWLASRPRVRAIGMVIAEINVATTIGLVALVATGVAPLTSLSGELALAVAAYTAVIGVVQYVGVRRIA